MNPKRSIIKKLMPVPIEVRHYEYSMLFSLDDDKSQPSEYLISTSLEAIEHTRKVSLNDISQRIDKAPYYPNIWPGEHYRLLAGFVLTLKPKLVIEIGTATGVSALSIKKYLSSESKIITFDVIDWKSYPEVCLREDDFKDGRLIQYIDDLSDLSIVHKYKDLLKEADMIFIDAAKDGIMEQKFMDNFHTITFNRKPLLIFDDIRIWNMLKIWRNISLPNMDLTSFGHWTGTGIVEWKTN